jgi:hypothetical protein
MEIVSMLVPVLKQLQAETTALLECDQLTPERWQSYAAKRTVLFDGLTETDFSAVEPEAGTVAALIRAILDQEAQVQARLVSRLDAIRQELSTLSTARHALQGYASHRTATLFKRCV